EALRLRRYPTLPRESDVFANEHPNPDDPHAVPRPAGVVIVGLGAEGELHAEELMVTVRQGVIGYAQHLSANPDAPSSFNLAATLIGSGGLGVSVGTSARAVAQGVRAANERLQREEWPIVAKLNFIEVYEDRATEALHELLSAAERMPAAFDVDAMLKLGTSPLPRPETPGYRGADYDMVSALDGPKQDGKSTIAFTIGTRGARTEVRSSTTQLDLVQALIKDAEADRRADTTLGTTLFRMLVPADLDSFFGNSEAVLLEIDNATAGVPWELLNVEDDDDESHDRPWSIRAKLVRKLQTKDFRQNPRAVGQLAEMLVIGNPSTAGAGNYASLEGAKREALAVAKVLGVARPHVDANARELVNALLGTNYSVVHIAGHGHEDGSGVVMSGGQVLGADLVKSMRRLPDLVFVNTCHSGRQPVGNLPGRAATLANALISAGVRCVIATGWAVDDDAAEHFADKFYRELLQHRSFMEATSRARESTWRAFPDSNTWAAYQCYGDPDWVWNRPAVAAATPESEASSSGGGDERASPIVSVAGLLVALKTLVAPKTPQSTAKLARLEAEFAPRFGQLGNVAEAFAVAYKSTGQPAEAIRWYAHAVRCEEGASFAALEQLCNLSVRAAEAEVERAYRQWQQDGDANQFGTAAARAQQTLLKCDPDLERLEKLHETYERTALLASSWKRRAMTAYAISSVQNDQAAKQTTLHAVDRSRELYERAAGLADDGGMLNAGYARLNEMTAQLVLDLLAGRSTLGQLQKVAPLRKSLEKWGDTARDFWPFIQLIELDVYEKLCHGTLADDLGKIEKALDELWSRMANPGEWASVRDQARFTLRPYAAGAGTKEEQAAALELGRIFEKYKPVKS
ncbi:MAG: CHAT domain-containing protein, partial [Polyangiaceae bacterium]